MTTPLAIERWHRVIDEGDLDALDALLADDVVFHSPVVHTPQEGKAITKLYLSAAANVLNADGEFSYVREVHGPRDAVLEFLVEVDGIVVNGVDLIRWNDADRIVDFKVMVRPLKAVNKLHALMASMLEQLKPTA
jgi:hypothetical protein